MNRRTEAGGGEQLDIESGVLISDLVEEKRIILTDIVYVKEEILLRRGYIRYFRNDRKRWRRAKYTRYSNRHYLLGNHNNNGFNRPIRRCFP